MDFDTYFAMQWYEKEQKRKQRHREEYRAMLKRQQHEREQRLLKVKQLRQQLNQEQG